MKKIVLLSLIFIVYASVQTQAQGPMWVQQASGFSVVGEYPFAIHVCDANVAWCVAYRGDGTDMSTQEFSMTMNAGNSWQSNIVTMDTNFRFSGIWAYDADTAYALMYNSTSGTSGVLYKTTNQGNTWSVIGTGQTWTTTCFPDVVYFWSATEGMQMGDPTTGNGNYFEIYLTSNAGQSWTRVPQANITAPTSGEYGIVSDFCVSNGVVWYGTNKGRIYKSSDHGQHWTAHAAGPAANTVSSIAFKDTMNGLCISFPTTGAASLYRTTDGGSTWTLVTPTGIAYYNSLAAIPNTNIYLSASASGTLGTTRGSSYSLDNGSSWTLIDSANGGGTTDGYTSFGFLDRNTGWAGGFTQSSTADGIYQWLPNSVNVTDVTPKAEMVAYPNPSSGMISIHLKPKSSNITLRLIDDIGKTVFANSYSTGAIFNKSFDFSTLPKGFYTLILNSGSEQMEHKLVIQ